MLTLLACIEPEKPSGASEDSADEAADADGDGYTGGDCAPDDPSIHPGAAETCDGVDQDCDGQTDEDATDSVLLYDDVDGDGFGGAERMACPGTGGTVATPGDCDDARAEVNPDAPEDCGDGDLDCDGDPTAGAVDPTDWYGDADGDGYGNPLYVTSACDAPEGYADNPDDCSDIDPETSPGALERCGGDDEDCDGTTDEDDAADATTWYADNDGDGYGEATTGAPSCVAPDGATTDATDCDDDDAATNPGAPETCGGDDEDCDGTIDEDDASDAPTWYLDADGDGYGSSQRIACDAVAGEVADGEDCDDTDPDANPGAIESCNDGVDEDCDGTIDDGCGPVGTISTADADAWLFGTAPGDYLGSDISGAGDMDADGYDDFVASGWYVDAGRGQVSLVPGPVTGEIDGASLTTISGETALDYVGLYLSGGGDHDGDGLPDLFVSGNKIVYLFQAPFTGDRTISDADATWLGGLGADAGGHVASGDVNGDGDDDLLMGATSVTGSSGAPNSGALMVDYGPSAGDVNLDYAYDAAIRGENSGGRLGSGISAQDIDGDGVADVALGGMGEDRCYLFLGPLSGLIDAGDADVALVEEAGTDYPGYSLDFASDADGDGDADLFVGAVYDDTGATSAGAAYVVTDLTTPEQSLSTATAKFYGTEPVEEVGVRVRAADVDGDARSDLLTGAYYGDHAFLLYAPFSGVSDIASAAAAQGATFEPAIPGELTVSLVASAGDVDGVGFDDVLVSSGSGAAGAGATWLWYGGGR